MSTEIDTLSKFFDAHPSAKAEHDTALAQAKADGVTEATEEFQAKVKAVTPFIGSKKYPAGVTTHAMTVLSGEMKLEAFSGAIMAYDMQTESKASDDAETETDKLKETAKSGTGGELSETGETESNAAFDAEIAREKKLSGQEG